MNNLTRLVLSLRLLLPGAAWALWVWLLLGGWVQLAWAQERQPVPATPSLPTAFATATEKGLLQIGPPEALHPDWNFEAGGCLAQTQPDSSQALRWALDGTWHFAWDDADSGRIWGWHCRDVARTGWGSQPVPGTWNLPPPAEVANFSPAELTHLLDRQTVGWYARRLDGLWLDSLRRAAGPNGQIKLDFGGAFRETQVWLNDHYLGQSQVPYLPFAFRIDSLLGAKDNWLVVRVDNRLGRQTLPADTRLHKGKHGWMPYGGLTRPVALVAHPGPYIAQVRSRLRPNGDWGAMLAVVPSDTSLHRLLLEVALSGPQGQPMAEHSQRLTLQGSGEIPVYGQVGNPLGYSPGTPNRYWLSIKLWLQTDSGLRLSDQQGYWLGFRNVEVWDGQLRYNGQPIFLKGINRHEDHPAYGPVFAPQVMARDQQLLRQLGVNFCRVGHYPNDPRVLQALEAQGILVAEEIPVYQWDLRQQRDTALVALAQDALRRMILRDINRAGVVVWSLANEIFFHTRTPERFLRGLDSLARRLDPFRPTLYAAAVLPSAAYALLRDRAAAVPSLVGLNHYHGWYYGHTRHAQRSLRRYARWYPNQPLLITEFGADALQGRHLPGHGPEADALRAAAEALTDPDSPGPTAPKPQTPTEERKRRHSYTEEFQAFLLERHLAQYAAHPRIQGVLPWVMADFRMQWTPNTGKPHPVPRTNLKGLVSADRTPKRAFDTYRSWLPPSLIGLQD